ncbi:MAG: hypothetical protein HZA49_07700 [Planctomycetes bacterium]|nr:hypothetical protein [Planctomycetota bacterium]
MRDKTRLTRYAMAILLAVFAAIFNYAGCGGGSSGSSGDGSTSNPPAQVASPVPANSSVDRPVNQQLGWAAASGATSYDVYFGITSAGWSPITTSITALNYTSPTALAYAATYYWRIDSKNSDGTTAGTVWSFQTRPASGSLDVSFDSDGVVTTTIGSSNEGARGIAIQSDNKIVVAGRADTGFNWDFALARYNANGSPDTTFGTSGITTTDLGGTEYVNALGIQSDGRIVAAGTNSPFLLARYTTAGILDTGFGLSGTGVVTTTIQNGATVNALAIQPDNTIIAAGKSWNGSNDDIAVARYSSDGVIDNTFGSNGVVTTAIGANIDVANSVAVTGTKIVVAGEYVDGTSSFALVQYGANGALDTTFDSDGIVTTTIESTTDYSFAVAIQPDNKIVVAGSSGDGKFALARYNTDGSLDATFDSDGIVTTTIGAGSSVVALAIQSDGKIVAVGTEGSGSQIALARYNTDGSLDTAFGTNGIVTTRVGVVYNYAYAVAIQSDGKIVVAGGSDGSEFIVLRYWP